MDIEEIAVLAVRNEIVKYSDMLVAYIDTKEKTPMWDGYIYIYKPNSKYKKRNEFEGKIGVQVKGKTVTKLSKGNSKYQIEVDYLRAYQKEKNGVLLLVVEIIDYARTQLFYANLLPVDLNEILKKIKEGQQKVSIDIKPIREKSSSSFKMICLNFLKNSKAQLNIEIKNIEDIENIEKINLTVVGDKEYLEDYLFNNDVYTYATEKETDKIYALPKWTDITRFETTKASVKVKGKEYYNQITHIKDKNEEYVLYGKSVKFYISSNKVSFKIKGNVYEKINDIEFILNLLENKEIEINGKIIPFPINIDKKSPEMYVSTLKADLIKLNRIKNLFEKFDIKFEKELDELNEKDLKNLDSFIKLNDGILLYDIKDSNVYYIDIVNVRIAFFITIDENKKVNIYNYFSDLRDKIKVFYFDKNKQEVSISPYINLIAKNLTTVSNANIEIMKNSFEHEPYSEETCERYNLWLLELIKAYDESKDKKWLEFAEFLNNKILNNNKSNAYIINKLQIIKRKRELLPEEKDILYEIKETDNNRMIQCAVAILLDNKSDYEKNYSKLEEKEKKIFIKFPIYNLLK